MHENALATRLVLGKLPDGFEKGQALDIANCAANLAQHKIDLVAADIQEILDLVCHVRNDLNGFA